MPSRDPDTLAVWSHETGRDRRNTRWAVLVAVAIHALFFRLELPQIAAADVRPPRPPLHVLRTPRFKPPPPREQQLLPEPRVRKVPWPDPTPDDPEPLLRPDRLETAVDLVDTDIVWRLPAAPPQPPATGPLRVGGEVLPPVKRHAPPPDYTEIARRARIQGVVQLEAVIDATGAVTRVRVIKGLPMGLDQAAVDAVREWRFTPATFRGKPVAVLYHLTINFRLT
jgi:protein TonB